MSTQLSYKIISYWPSEDDVNAAANIKNNENRTMWSTAEAEKKAHIDIVFTRDAEIDSIEIVNNCAAFVEILVSKESKFIDDPQSLLPIVGLRSSKEAKEKKNTDIRRLFKTDKMHRINSSKKWRSMRVVLTQPFSERVPIGLRYLKITDKGAEVVPSPKKEVRPEPISSSPSIVLPDMMDLTDSESDSIGHSPLTALRTMTLVRKQSSGKKASSQKTEFKKTPPPPEIAATFPDTVDLTYSDIAKAPPKKKPPPKKQKTIEIAPTFPDSIDFSFSDSHIEEVLKKKEKPAPKTEPKKAAPKKVIKKASPKKEPSPKKAKASSKKPLEGTCVVLSGFQNPIRSQLREAAVGLGARYANDWKDGGTHLVTAFTNTPKYNEVDASGKGYIVSKEWLLDTKKQNKRQPENQYRLQSDDSDESSVTASSGSGSGSDSSSDFWASSDPTMDGFDSDSSSACRINSGGDLVPVKKNKKLNKQKPKQKVKPKPKPPQPSPSPKKKIITKTPEPPKTSSPEPPQISSKPTAITTAWKKVGSPPKKVLASISQSPAKEKEIEKTKNKTPPGSCDREIKNRKQNDDEKSDETVDVDREEIDRGIEKLQRWARQQQQQTVQLQSSLPESGSIIGLPSFLKGVLIYVSPSFSFEKIRNFKKRVCAGGGRIVTDQHSATHSIVSNSETSDISSSILVLPSWLGACESSKRIVPPTAPHIP